LSLTEQVSFEQHLETCPECEQAHQRFLRLRQEFRQSNLRFELPPELQAKLRRTVGPGRRAMRRALAIAASIAIVVLAGSLVWMSRSNRPALTQDLVDAHIRSLQA